ncbi:hypothetical protein M8818_006802 [Zalaria obscura]|uniref:Uncharacterized protein n=1 Tax=Zalaria obscura TaxID=2024903 RepID=A0ACC3S630_9PEZI
MITSFSKDTLKTPEKSRKPASMHVNDGPNNDPDRVASPALSVRSHGENLNGRASAVSRDHVENKKNLASGDLRENVLPAQLASDRSTPDVKPNSTTRNSSIADSIPLRTSSLHQQHNNSPRSNRSKTRSSKSSDKSRRRSEPFTKATPPELETDPVPALWEELGEEDHTVKRIKELKKQQEERRRQTIMFPEHGIGSASESSLTSAAQATDAGNESNAAPRARPTTKKAAPAVDNSKAHRILGITKTLSTPRAEDLPASNSIISNGQAALINGRPSSPQLARDQGVSTSHARPSSSNATHSPHLSLDYSYAAAVDALGGVRPAQITTGTSQRISDPPKRRSLVLEGLDLKLDTVIAPSRPETLAVPSPISSAQKKKHRKSEQWLHPDLPDINQKKNRRKSMNDARIPDDEYIAARRDSIEDAVDSYLHNPRLSRTVRHPQTGRLISYSDVGDPNGAVVIVCVGMGLTRYVTAFYDELAATLRLRLITPDRPGVSASEPYRERDHSGPLSWPDDVLTICHDLGITQFSILAHSAGAIYALATALILPHCIRGKVQLLAPWIPPSQLEDVSSKSSSATPVGALPRSQRLLRVLPTPFLKAANSGFMAGATASLKPASKRRSPNTKYDSSDSTRPSSRDNTPSKKSKKRPEPLRRESLMLMDQTPMQSTAHTFPLPVVPEDEDTASTALKRESLKLGATATPTEADFSFAAVSLQAAEHAARERQTIYSSLLTERTWMLATREANPAVDLLVCLERQRGIGFRYVDVKTEVVITHGSGDRRVPVENVRWVGERMNRRSWTDEAESGRKRGGCEVRVLEGEGHGLMASPLVMAGVLEEIAGEWRGWGLAERKG